MGTFSIHKLVQQFILVCLLVVWHFPALPALAGAHSEAVPAEGGQGSWGTAYEWVLTGRGGAGKC